MFLSINLCLNSRVVDLLMMLNENLTVIDKYENFLGLKLALIYG